MFIIRRNLSVAVISTSLLLAKQFSSNSKHTLLSSSQIPSFSSSFPSIQTGFLPSSSSSICEKQRPLFYTLRSDHTMASQSKTGSVYDFTVKDARGNDVDLSIYKGKVLLIVNVASQCIQWDTVKAVLLGPEPVTQQEYYNGLTNSNYTELSQVYQKYKDQGLEILAFPCNQFNGQEPGSNEEIVDFVCTRFKAEYPIFDKVDVNGENAAPIYKFLKSSKGGLFGDSIKWNFSKFLVDKDGNVVERYAPTTSPLSIEKDIKKLLGSS